MFGLFKPKNQVGESLASIGLHPAYSALKADCPGGAYIFARTVRNTLEAWGALDDRRRVELVSQAIREGEAHEHADGGMSRVAFEAMLVSIWMKDALARRVMVQSLARIAADASTYRELDERDQAAPAAVEDRELLRGNGSACIADWVHLIEEEGVLKGAALRETVDTIVASWDIRSEVRSGALDRNKERLLRVLSDARG
jgi:hypothetical protein